MPLLTGSSSRRGFLQGGTAQALAWAAAQAWWSSRAVAVEEPGLVPLNHFPRMVQEFYVARLGEFHRRRLETLDRLKSRADAETYVASVRDRIRQCFGPVPEKTPLNARVTGVVERDAYRVEKVIFESRPGFLVTANLYIPRNRAFPLPGVVGSCGHSANGKANEAYQSFAQGLARLGYVVLIFDPIGQGERLQYLNGKLGSKIGVGVLEHLMAGNQQVLIGERFWAWRAWDGIRALDYLLTRPEVDPKQVGVTGNSGGGTMTTWLCGVEQRWTMAAPSCFVTSFRRNLENELPADIEQCPPSALALGLDHEDFLAALAPKPIIILAKERDYFDVRGSTEAYQRLRRLYGLLGAEEQISLFVGPTEHGYSRENREAMYRWFNRVTRVSDATSEPALTIEQDEILYCTPRGQVSELGSKSVPALTAARSRELRNSRPPLRPDQLPAVLSAFLKLPPRAESPEYRILRPLRTRQYPKRAAVPYAVQTEPGIHALVTRLYDQPHLSRPPAGFDRAILYVSHHSADTELRDEPMVRELIAAEPGSAVFACDLRGIGESRPDTCGERTFLQPYGCDYFYAAHGLMLDRPYPAQRTHDLMVVLDWLRATGHRQVHLAAKGWGAIPAAFAAVLSDLVVQVTFKHALTAFAAVAEAETYSWPLSAFPFGVLARFDLPDCYRVLAAKQLRQIEPLGP